MSGEACFIIRVHYLQNIWGVPANYHFRIGQLPKILETLVVK